MRLEPMQVARIEDPRGSHIEPPLNQSWDAATTLRWRLGVTQADSGITVTAETDAWWKKDWRGKFRPVPDTFSLNVGGMSCSAFTLDEAWKWLNGFDEGVRVASEQTAVAA